jgi:hypothetical protein
MRNKLWKFSDMAGKLWCGVMHDEIMWPVNGRYRCRTCRREYTVSWERNGVRPRADAIKAKDRPGSVHQQTTAACPA